MLVKDFIRQVFLSETKRIVYDYKFHYLSFSLMAIGIEFLGACLDSYEFSKRDVSGERFRNAIGLFPDKYKEYNKKGNKYDLCDNLRNNFAHYLAPGSEISLSDRKGNKEESAKHLEFDNRNKLVLVAEDLFDDFEKACNEIVRRIDNKELTSGKVYRDFLHVYKG